MTKLYLKHLTLSTKLILVLAFTLLYLVPTYGQTPCDTSEYHFTGVASQTLCELNGEKEFDIILGTTVDRTSQLTGNSVTGNIHIIDDFIVDKSFSFVDCLIKIEPGVSIQVVPSGGIPISPFSSTTLTLDNSKLFTCDDLWQGIVMGLFSVVRSQNGTIIEDAQNAIFSNVKSWISIDQTTFNRNNNTCISLRRGGSSGGPSIFSPAGGPILMQLSDSKFTCTAPINGTSNKITDIGIESDVSLSMLSKSNNEFIGITAGIVTQGNVTVNARRLLFRNIRDVAIRLREGTLRLEESELHNCVRGIIISEVQRLRFFRNKMLYDDAYLPGGISKGIEVFRSKTNAHISIDNNDFSTATENSQRELIAIRGGALSDGTAIFMAANEFFIDERGSKGIALNGEFPRWTNSWIEGNRFYIDGPGGTSRGIEAVNGNKSNLNLLGNRFIGIEKEEESFRAIGVSLDGSLMGTGNQVSALFSTPVNDSPKRYFSTGINVRNFTNTLYCNSRITACNRGIVMNGLNSGTEVKTNRFFADGIDFYLGPNTITDQQGVEGGDHNGNRWEDKISQFLDSNGNPFFATQTAGTHALCDGCNFFLSQVLVHTPRGASIYHPQRIIPDNDFWFRQDANGSPLDNCFPFNIIKGSLKEYIADGSIVNYVSDPLTIHLLERHLYQYLNINPQSDSIYVNFLNTNANTIIGELHEVYNQIEQAFEIDDPTMDSLSLVYHENVVSLNDSLKIVDSLILYSTDSAAFQQAQQNKIELIHQLFELDSLVYHLQANHEVLRNQQLVLARQLNEDIHTTSYYDSLEREVLDIYLQVLAEQNNNYSSTQFNELESISNLPFDTAGIAVYMASGLIPDCSPDTSLSSSFSAPQQSVYIAGSTPSFTNQEVRIYPNPSSGIFTINTQNAVIEQCLIYDMNGRLLRSYTLGESKDNTTINAYLLPGLYFCTLKYQNGIQSTQKLIIH
ncbi:MAG: T9SS type A sorting domain-containing protein [Bacteroidota bacterium]